ncbi:hypothetical protein BU17DRAFT_17578, partial [Hysterangium stoloniferum]
FRSAEQEEGLNRVKARRSNLIVVLPTGGGKALLWMLPAKTFWSGKSVIVVVPLVALLADCERRCQEAGVTYGVWSKDEARPFTSVVFVSAEEAITGEFLGYAKHMCALGRLMYIYIEEGHLIMAAANYREKLPYL